MVGHGGQNLFIRFVIFLGEIKMTPEEYWNKIMGNAERIAHLHSKATGDWILKKEYKRGPAAPIYKGADNGNK